MLLRNLKLTSPAVSAGLCTEEGTVQKAMMLLAKVGQNPGFLVFLSIFHLLLMCFLWVF